MLFKSKLIGFAIVSMAVFTAGQVKAQSSGEALYKKKCGRCHESYKPAKYSAQEWPGVVRSMKKQATLSAEDMEAITSFLVGASGEVEESEANSGPTWGGYLYSEYFKTETKTVNFDIHYLALFASGWVNDKIAYLGEFELEHGGTGGNNTFVEQAYLDIWFRQNIALKIGAMLTPFNRFDEFHDPLSNPLITRPQMSRELGVSAWKDVGVDLHGYFNISQQNSLSLDAYALNGLGNGKNLRGSRQYRDNNEELSYGARLNYLHRDILEIGASGYQGAWDDGGDFKVTMFGVHLMFKTDLVDLYAEFASAESENPKTDTLGNLQTDGEMSGYFVQLSRLFAGKYRTSARLGGLDYLDGGAALGRVPTDKELVELAFGFTYYPDPDVALKIEFTAYNEGSRVTETENNQVGLQAAVRF